MSKYSLFITSKKFNKAIKNVILAILIVIILFSKRIIKREIRICLCVIGKNENLYAKEFIEHYKKIGYNNVFLYDNNEKKGEFFEEVINNYIQNGFVKIINFRERKSDTRPQLDAYKDCYYRNNKSFDWLSFYDMDEFLELNTKYKRIQDFLGDKIFTHCQNIKINWLVYNNENSLYFENKPLKERLTIFHYNDPGNKHIKSTVRGNLSVNYWGKLSNTHSSTLNITSCSSSGKEIKYDSPFNEPPDFTNAKLKHYYYKSFEEYLLKVKKGKADFTKNQKVKRLNENYKKIYDENKNNKEKLEIIYNIFNNSNYDFLKHAKKNNLLL